MKSVIELEEQLSRPGLELIEMMKRLEGDIMILGIGGKMGPTMGRLAVNAIREAGVNKKVYGVARFPTRKNAQKWNHGALKPSLAIFSIRKLSKLFPRSKILFLWLAESSELRVAKT